jgi:hypothetical protein
MRAAPSTMQISDRFGNDNGRSALAARTALRAPRAVPRLICKFEDMDSAASTRRALRLVFVHSSIGALIMTRFMFLVLERHRVVAPTSAWPLVAPVPIL